jgi:hypothetical protein
VLSLYIHGILINGRTCQPNSKFNRNVPVVYFLTLYEYLHDLKVGRQTLLGSPWSQGAFMIAKKIFVA